MNPAFASLPRVSPAPERRRSDSPIPGVPADQMPRAETESNPRSPREIPSQLTMRASEGLWFPRSMENAHPLAAPALEARLVVEPAGGTGPGERGRILRLPAPGAAAALDLASPADGLSLRAVEAAGVSASARESGLVEVLPAGAGGTSGLRVLVIPPRTRHATAGGWIPDPPVILLHERESVVLEAGSGGAAWTLHLTAFRRPIGPPNPVQVGRPCPVCRRPIGEGPVYRCACGASLHHDPREVGGAGRDANDGRGARGEQGPGCSRVADSCPVCQRPVRPDQQGYTWLPQGFVAEEAGESRTGTAPSEGGAR